MLGRLHHLIIDCPEPRALAHFYSALLGQPITYDSDDFDVVAANDKSSGLAFQLAPDHRRPTWPGTAVPQQMHLDVMVEYVAEATPHALALGATRARAVFSVILPAAIPCIITGIVLALARISGETAPLLFTSFNNQFFSTNVRQPMASMTVQIFNYATSSYEDWIRQAWAGALVLVTFVLICSLLARVVTARLQRLRG